MDIQTIMDKVKREADYQNEHINHDIALGMYYALDIIRREIGGTENENNTVGDIEEGEGADQGVPVPGIQAD